MITITITVGEKRLRREIFQDKVFGIVREDAKSVKSTNVDIGNPNVTITNCIHILLIPKYSYIIFTLKDI